MHLFFITFQANVSSLIKFESEALYGLRKLPDRTDMIIWISQR